MNAIMAWCAGYESGVCTSTGGSRVKNIRGVAGVCPRESCEEYHPLCRDIFCQGSQDQGLSQVYNQGTRWLGDCRQSQSQGMEAGEVSHRVRMDELRPVVPGPSCSSVQLIDFVLM